MANWVEAAVFGAILNGVAVGTVLAAAVWLWLRFTPRLNAATRYALWLAALAAVLALPFLMAQMWPAAVVLTPAAAEPDGVRLVLPAPGAWFRWALAAWAVVSLVLLARIAWSAAALSRLKRRARPVGEPWAAQFESLRAEHAGGRRVRLGVLSEVRSPMAAGLFHPVILVPESLVERLSEEEFRQVLVHELAHIRRWDDWTCVAQNVAEAAFFFHPAVHWISRRLNLEREIACDDWVVSATGAARPYAACLTKLIEFGRLARAPQLAPGAAARKPQISRRIESLLSRRRASSPRYSLVGALAGVSALAAGLLFGMHAAPVAVAEPAIAALPLAVAPVEAPQMAYTPPPRPAPAVQPKAVKRAVPQQLVAAARPARELMVVEIVYWEESRPGRSAPAREWFGVFWTLTSPAPKTPGQT